MSILFLLKFYFIFTTYNLFITYYLSHNNLFHLLNYNLVDLDAVGYNGWSQHYGYLDLKAHLSATAHSGKKKTNTNILSNFS